MRDEANILFVVVVGDVVVVGWSAELLSLLLLSWVVVAAAAAAAFALMTEIGDNNEAAISEAATARWDGRVCMNPVVVFVEVGVGRTDFDDSPEEEESMSEDNIMDESDDEEDDEALWLWRCWCAAIDVDVGGDIALRQVVGSSGDTEEDAGEDEEMGDDETYEEEDDDDGEDGFFLCGGVSWVNGGEDERTKRSSSFSSPDEERDAEASLLDEASPELEIDLMSSSFICALNNTKTKRREWWKKLYLLDEEDASALVSSGLGGESEDDDAGGCGVSSGVGTSDSGVAAPFQSGSTLLLFGKGEGGDEEETGGVAGVADVAGVAAFCDEDVLKEAVVGVEIPRLWAKAQAEDLTGVFRWEEDEPSSVSLLLFLSPSMLLMVVVSEKKKEKIFVWSSFVKPNSLQQNDFDRISQGFISPKYLQSSRCIKGSPSLQP